MVLMGFCFGEEILLFYSGGFWKILFIYSYSYVGGHDEPTGTTAGLKRRRS